MAYIGNDVRSNEDYKIIDDISSGFNGSTTSFALQVGGATPVPFPKFEQQLLISVNGVIQEPDPTGSAGFKLLGTNIVFSSAPTNGHAFFGVIYAGADYVNAGGTFPDGSINFPSITFSEDTNTGFTRTASGTISVISDGTKVAQFPTSQGSNGQVLVTDGGGTLSYSSIITSPIVSGDLTIPDKIVHAGDTDTAIRFPAADTFSVETAGTEKLRVDSGGHISIGTATSRAIGGSVERKLQIEATSADAGVAITRNSANAIGPFLSFGKSRSSSVGGTTVVQSGDQLGQINFSGADGSDIVSNAASIAAFVDGTPGSNDMPGRLIFSTTADGAASVTERMRIDSSGNVGIGDTNPDSGKLHISSSTGTIGYFESTQAATNPANIVGNSTQTNSSSNLILQVNGGTTAQGIVRLNGDNSIAIHNGATPTEKLRIDSSGNVGIGTTSPAFKLDVVGAIHSSAAITGQDFRSDAGTTFFLTTGSDYRFRNTGGTERMRIDSSGKVGIGATDPSAKFEINASGLDAAGDPNDPNDYAIVIRNPSTNNQGNGIAFTNDSGAHVGGAIIHIDKGSNNLGDLAFYTAASSSTPEERMRITSTGLVGIGITSPATLLQIESTDPTFRVKRSDGSAYGELTSDTSGLISFKSDPGNTANGSGFIFTVDNSEKARIDSDGDLLVGLTTALSTQAGSIQAAGPILAKSYINSHTSSAIVIDHHSNVSRIRTYGATSGTGVLAFNTGGGGGAADSEAMRIDSSGNVGIGETSAETLLHIKGTDTAYSGNLAVGAIFQAEDVQGRKVQLVAPGNPGQAGVGTPTNHNFTIFTGNNERIRVDTSGNVGVGTASPAYNLDISNSSGEGQLRIDSSAGNHGMIRFSQGGTNKSYIGHFNGNVLAFGPGGSEKVRIDSSGNVGIQNENPGSFHSSGQDLVVGSGVGEEGMTIFSGNTSGGVINFADSTSGSDSYEGRIIYNHQDNSMRFHVNDGGERMRITSTGFLYYGTTGQGPHGGFYNIDASGGASASNALNVKGTTTNYVMVSSSGVSSGNHIFFNNYNGGNTNTGTIQDNGSNISYNTSSDYRIKENIVAISDGLTRVKQLNPVRHTFKNNSAVGTVDGWLAHELDTICPYAVNGEKDAVNEDGSIKLQGVDYGRITPLLTAALKEAITKIETLETKVAALEAA